MCARLETRDRPTRAHPLSTAATTHSKVMDGRTSLHDQYRACELEMKIHTIRERGRRVWNLECAHTHIHTHLLSHSLPALRPTPQAHTDAPGQTLELILGHAACTTADTACIPHEAWVANALSALRPSLALSLFFKSSTLHARWMLRMPLCQQLRGGIVVDDASVGFLVRGHLSSSQVIVHGP